MVRGRRLEQPEKDLARRVFGNCFPVDDIYLVDILGLGGRPFTIPGEVVVITLAAARLCPGLGFLLDTAILAAGPFGPLGFAVFEGIRAIAGELTLTEALGDYLVCMGRDVYNSRDATNFPFVLPSGMNELRTGQTFVHELTHVWQGEHGFINWEYVINSLWNQLTSGDGAYDYSPAGQAWSSYNAEQQAEIVEDWFAGRVRTGTDAMGNATYDMSPMFEDIASPLYSYIRNVRSCSSSGPSTYSDAIRRAGGNPRNVRQK